MGLVRSLLDLEQIFLRSALSVTEGKRALFISVNPDLVSDFGHFLNYERRMRERCATMGLDYLCFANKQLTVTEEGLTKIFEHKSGHYSLTQNSATGREHAIAEDLYDSIVRGISVAEPGADARYDDVFVFMYCGSSLLAAQLCDFSWPDRVHVSVNAFWDFLLPDERLNYAHVMRLKFQKSVRLLAMSELHANEVQRKTGLSFESCANPPPLLDDVHSYEALRLMLDRADGTGATSVLVPGLMTMGKGRDLTLSLYETCNSTPSCGVRFIFRDRARGLSAPSVKDVSVISGDLTDERVIDLYRASDIAVLPYEAPVFAMRTSGALVDCRMFGVVPVVMSGTWLADVCERFGFGRIASEATVACVLEQVRTIQANLDTERTRVFRAAARYLATNNWDRFMALAMGTVLPATPRETIRHASRRLPSMLSAANRLHQEGQYSEALCLYRWLASMSDLSIYRWNIARCESMLERSNAQNGARTERVCA